MSTETTATDAGAASAQPTTPPADLASDSFESAIGAKLDAAFAAAGSKPPEPKSEPTEKASDASSEPAPEPKADESSLPGGDVAPPSDKVAPPDPDSDEAIERDIDRTTKGWEARQREAFKDKTYKLRELKRQNKALEAKIAEAANATNPNDAKALEAANAKLQEMQAKVAEYESKMAQVDLTQTSAWQEQVVKPFTEINNLVGKLAAKYSSDPETLRAALMTTGEDRSDKIASASAEMNDFDRNLFFQAALRQEYVEAQAASMRENAAGTVQQLTEAQRAQAEQMAAQAKAEWDSAVPKAWDRVASMTTVLTEADGADDWNAAISKAKTFASTVKFGDLGVTEQAEVMHRAAAFPLMGSMVRALEGEVAALRETLSKYKVAAPAAGGATASTAGAKASAVASDVDWESAIEAKFREAGLA